MQFRGLAITLLGQVVADPVFVLAIIRHVGILPILQWLVHFLALGTYTALYAASKPVNGIAAKLPPKQQHSWHRQVESWKFGSGQDYKL